MLNALIRAKNKKGFTIIELVVVIAVIGILSAILLPNFSGSLQRADSTAKAANLSSVNKIAATAAVSAPYKNEQLAAYAAVCENFGEETARATGISTLYSSKDNKYVSIEKVDEEEIDTTYYHPFYIQDGQSAEDALKSLDFVQSGTGSNYITALAKEGSKCHALYSEGMAAGFSPNYYLISESITLYDDLALGTSIVVFLDGASLACNGHAFNCGGLLFLETKGQPVEFTFGGSSKMAAEFGVGVFKVTNFYDAAGKFNAGGTPEISKNSEITLYQTGELTITSGGFVASVENASWHLIGGMLMSKGGKVQLYDKSHFVVENGGYLLTDSGEHSPEDARYSAVYLWIDDGHEGVTMDVADGSVVALSIDTNSENFLINGSIAMDKQNFASVSPLTYEVCAGAVETLCALYASVGVPMEDVQGIAAKFCTAVTTSAQGYATEYSLNSAAFTATTAGLTAAQAGNIGAASQKLVNNVIAATTVASGASSVTAAVQNVAAISVSAFSGVNSKVSLANVAATQRAYATGGSSGGSGESAMSYDISWYTGKENVTYTLSDAKDLYGLSIIVYNGWDSFYGSTIKLDSDIDLSVFSNWTPIGNGRYGFRGTFDGQGHTIKNMNISANSLSSMTNLVNKAWNHTTGHASDEGGVNYGLQAGDKYGVGFIGVLENGGTLKNVTFENCKVSVQYSNNSYAAIAVGAVVSTGEDYSFDGGSGKNGGKYISGTSGGHVTYGDTPVGYAKQGAKWPNSEKADGKGNDIYTETDYNYIPYAGWTTTVEGVTVKNCSVESTGRCGGVIATVAGRYYTNSKYNLGLADGTKDAYSIFAGWGVVNVKDCHNSGTNVTLNNVVSAYAECAGVLGYTQVNDNITLNIGNCSASNCTITGPYRAGVYEGNGNKQSVAVYGTLSASNVTLVEKLGVTASGLVSEIAPGYSN